jgi:biotin carboxylase
MTSRTYRAGAFLRAAHRLQVDVAVASEEGSTLGHLHPDRELVWDLRDPSGMAEAAAKLAAEHPIDAVVPVDEAAVLAAAYTAQRLGRPGNSIPAVAATRNKLVLRQRLSGSSVGQPEWCLWPEEGSPPMVGFPCVVKPLDQAASRGVIRADDEAGLLRAGGRVREMLAADADCAKPEEGIPLLVERFVCGPEVAVEVLLVDGALQVVAVYDKPEPLDGPFFEETVYVVPSMLRPARLDSLEQTVRAAASGLGLTHGSIPAELRLGAERPVLIDLAARSIGGSCSRVLHFRSGRSLEEFILLAALGDELGELALEAGSRGVLMMPIPKGGILRSVAGREELLSKPAIDGVEVTVPTGGRVIPPPEGDRYLGFIFAHGDDAATVTAELWAAYRRLDVLIVD